MRAGVIHGCAKTTRVCYTRGSKKNERLRSIRQPRLCAVLAPHKPMYGSFWGCLMARESNTNHVTTIAKREGYGGRGEVVTLDAEARRRHLYVVGKSGSGKSTLIGNMIVQDIHQGRGLTFLDPHGDLSLDLLDQIPPARITDVLYFDAACEDHPVGFNLLEKRRSANHLVTSSVIDVLRSMWQDSWGPRMEYILSNAVAALVEREGSTLLGVQKILVNREFRQHTLRFVRDPIIRAFWHQEFDRWPQRFQQEAIAPIQNKVGRITGHPVLRNIVGQVRSTFDPRRVMDEQRIVIVNLARGVLGADASSLLGSLLVAAYGLAAFSRADTPSDRRTRHSLYVDEVQHVGAGALSALLSEGAKYGAEIIAANQFTSQLDDMVRGAIFGNVQTIISFSVGASDSLHLEREFSQDIKQQQLTELAPYEVFIKTGSLPEERVPFRARTLPPLGLYYGRSRSVVRRSRAQFTRSQEKVERKIARFLR